jgi:hypothetical protein
VELDSETTGPHHSGVANRRRAVAQRDFDEGFLLGLLVGEGHFGGDGKQPHVTLRMHVRHEGLFRWIESRFPGGRLYGPYHHGGRDYFQWMARGAYLRERLLPLLRARRGAMDDYTGARFEAMCERYSIGPGRGAA